MGRFQGRPPLTTVGNIALVKDRDALALWTIE
jgi:hypothetical protein